MRQISSLLLVLIFFIPAAFAEDPSNLAADLVSCNVHIKPTTNNTGGLKPVYSWSYSGTTMNWQIQVDDSINFSNIDPTALSCWPSPTIHFWDSGLATKANGNARSAAHRSVCITGCSCNADLEFRPTLIHWRVRVQDAATGVWSNWVASTEKLNFPPLWPYNQATAVDTDPTATADPLCTDPMCIFGSAAPAPTTYYVDTATGSDSNPGTIGSPFDTLNYATRQLRAGDTLIVVGSVAYGENVTITGAAHQSGTPTNPITVIANVGDDPYVSAPLNAFVIQGVHDWVIDGIDSASTSNATSCSGDETYSCSGIQIINSDNIVIKNFTTPLSITPDYITAGGHSNGIVVANSRNVRILNSLFNQSLEDMIDYAGGNDFTIQQCEFTTSSFSQASKNVNHPIQLHPGSHGNVLIDSSYFHDMNVGEGVIYNYKGAFARYTHNVFYKILGTANSGFGAAVIGERSGPIQFENNTCFNMAADCLKARWGTGPVTFRNNIVAHSTPLGSDRPVGITLSALDAQVGSTTRGTIIDNNNFFNLYLQPTGITIDPTGGNSTAQMDHVPTNNITSDPNFVSINPADIATNFLRLGPASLALDVGDPNTPVPTLGGATVDIGRFERGETNDSMTKLYTYQPETAALMDSTPRFTWALLDEDNILDTCCDLLPPGDSDRQDRFQIQLDRAVTFNSRSAAHPDYESGTVISPNMHWTVPDSLPLTLNTQYYMRVRQADEEDPNTFGPWSDATWAMSVDDDLENAAPVIVSSYPTANQTGVNCDETYELSPYTRGLIVRVVAHDNGGTIVPWGLSDCIRIFKDGVELPLPGLVGPSDCILSDADKTATVTYGITGLASGSTHTLKIMVKDNLANFYDSTAYSFTCGTVGSLGFSPPSGVQIYKVPE